MFIIIMHKHAVWYFIEVKLVNLSPKGNEFSIALDPILNGENMQFWKIIFIVLVFGGFFNPKNIINKIIYRVAMTL
jgi:hypothetical protein